MKKFTDCILIIILFLGGCASWETEKKLSAFIEKTAVTLTVSAEKYSNDSMKTVLPRVPTQLTYRFKGISGGVTTQFGVFPLSSFSVQINPGTWDFTLEALDENSVSILSGTLSGQVINSSVQNLAFILKPLATGTGAIDITVSWDAVNVVTSVVAKINDVTADPSPVLTGNQAVLMRPTVVSGNYMVSFRLFNSNGTIVTTVTELVRVAPGLTSSKTIALTEAVDFNKPPVAPDGLTAEWYSAPSNTFGIVKLQWNDNSVNETGHKLYYTVDGSTDLITLSSGLNNYLFNTAIRGKSYSFKITAINSFGESAVSNTTNPLLIPMLYSITFDPNFGSGVLGPQLEEGGKPAGLYQNYGYITRSGFTFLGWATNSGANVAEFNDGDVITMPSGNLNLFAVWATNQTYTVTFNSQGAETIADPSTDSVTTQGTPLGSLPTQPVRSGFEFAGWWTTALTDGSKFIATTPVSTNIIVYARWIPMFTSYTLPLSTNVQIDQAAKLITVTMPYASVVTSLTATFATGADSVLVNGITQTTAATANNFSNPVVYTLSTTGCPTQKYAVRVVKSENSALSGVTNRDMVMVPGGTFTQESTGASFSHTLDAFRIAKHEVSYELWYAVRIQAETMGYDMYYDGRAGSEGTDGDAPDSSNKFQPVTNISWRDAIVWCNAYSELAGLTPVYYTDSGFTLPLKLSTNSGTISSTQGSEDYPYIKADANGYRLPIEGEWQYAAGYTDYGVHQLYTHVSGDTTNPYNVSTFLGDYAWHQTNSGVVTKVIGTKLPNGLGLLDMSGNVGEWCFDWYATLPTGGQTNYVKTDRTSETTRVGRGGTSQILEQYLQVGARNWAEPYYKGTYQGFRVAGGVVLETNTPATKSANIGQSFYYQIADSTLGTCWGTGVYTADSPVATTAVHAGKIINAKTGIVKVTILPGMSTYEGSPANGVTTQPYTQYGLSYIFE